MLVEIQKHLNEQKRLKTPRVAYKQHANLRAMLVRAKLPNGASKSRKFMGMKKCQKGFEWLRVCAALKSWLKYTVYTKLTKYRHGWVKVFV